MTGDTTFQFIESLYFPGFMSLLSAEQDGREARFSFMPKEPQVSPVSAHYFTPRGAHITISQAGLYLIENVLAAEGLFNISPEQYRELTRKGHMKITELNQKFRREIGVNEPVEARFSLDYARRFNRMPLVKVSFNLADRAFRGDFTAVIEQNPVPQTNEDIMIKN